MQSCLEGNMFDRETAKNLLTEVDSILQSIDLPYFLSYGTALGAHRDGDFTPTEVDMDIGFLIEDFLPKSSVFVKLLLSKDYEVTVLQGPFTKPYIVIVSKHNIKIDMVALIPWNDQIYGGGLVRLEPNNDHPFAGVYPGECFTCMETTSMFGRLWPIPNQIKKYLHHVYGANWTTPSIVADHTHHHHISRFVEIRGVPKDLLEQYK